MNTVALVTWRIHWSDSADEFIETFQTMYEQGERKVSAVKPGESNGDVTESEGQRTRRYDPKARAYVGEYGWIRTCGSLKHLAPFRVYDILVVHEAFCV